jgi:hypothetical protein
MGAVKSISILQDCQQINFQKHQNKAIRVAVTIQVLPMIALISMQKINEEGPYESEGTAWLPSFHVVLGAPPAKRTSMPPKQSTSK